MKFGTASRRNAIAMGIQRPDKSTNPLQERQMLTVQNGEPPNESVPRAFYRELLTVFADVQYLKAEFAYWKAVQDQRAPKRRASARKRKKRKG